MQHNGLDLLSKFIPETAENVLPSAGVISHCMCTLPKAVGPLANARTALPSNPFSGSPTYSDLVCSETEPAAPRSAAMTT